MTDEGNAPTIPDSQAGTQGPGPSGVPPNTPDSRYALRTLLGQGGMGEVWLAYDARVDREIAVKLMRGGAGDPDLVARFLREARVQGRLEHPSVVPVHDLGGADATAPYFAMKRLTGTTLADVLAGPDKSKWPRRTLLARFVDVCLAVEFAHQRGVVHRDLKPANIMLGDFGEAYVLDWGLARVRGDSEIGARPSGPGAAAGETEVGAMLGTPGYMSPEQVRGEQVDGRTDVFALGCILFEILAGAPANRRDRAIADTLAATEHRPSTNAGDVPPELDEACARATAADRSARLDTARGLADMVQRFLDGDRDLARRRELAATHVARAQELAAKGDSGRVEAIREAGSAIALDVENTAAQRLLAHLLLDPPKAIPPGAQKAIEQTRRAEGLVVLRNTALAYVTFLLALPAIVFLGVAFAWPILVITAEVSALLAICYVGYRRKVLIVGRLAAAILIGHCILLATIALVVGPLLLAPVLIFGSSTIMLTITSIRLPKLIVASHLLVIAVPLALELAGVVPRTFDLAHGGILLQPWAVDASPFAFVVVLVGTTVLQLLNTMIVLDGQRMAQQRAVERIHVQAWQLQQLVPSSGSSS